ncbi:uncharacterized protein LOC114464381 [Gouania willdenowi]|uniref:uncharacterized protein LOC114464381 n=1 Tax=Gouania willdenowi TaxID=441366 RepID=UPI00105546D3|nr:uncharacterized protein LOC114464381 [Gouania willdenowi]
MAFVNLFTSLSSPKEDSGRHAQPAFTHRNFTDYSPRGGFRKRKTNKGQPGSPWKRPCNREQTNTAHDASMDRNSHHPHGADRGNNCYHGQNPQRTNGSNGNKQHQQQQQGNKNNNKKNNYREDVTNRGWHSRRGGRKGAPGRKYGGQDVRTKTMRMDPKFKEQNVVELDGRMLCRHFFLGACIKGDQCQLEHIQGYNGLIKECCKFYVQGQCSRGQSCPFMHKSVPCKFFHRRNNCSQGANCRFSHEPLDEVTGRVLEMMLKRENDFIELAKKAKEEASGLPAKPMASDSNSTGVQPTTDVVTTLPLRPNFYNSAEKEMPPEEVPPSNDDIPSSPSTQTNHQPEPVCYSVQAVLGPSLSKPFTGFQTNFGAQESTSPSANFSLHKNEVPYSVEAMFGSCKTESMAIGQKTASPKWKTKCYYPRADPIGNIKSSQSPQVHKEEGSLNNNKESLSDSPKRMFKTLPSLQEFTKRSTHDLGAAGVSEKSPKSLKTTQSSSCEEMRLPLGPEAKKCESSDIKVHVKESQYQPIGNAHTASFSSFPSRTFSSATFCVPLTESPQSLQDQHKKDSLKTLKEGVLEFEKTMYKTIPSLRDSTNSAGLSQVFRDKRHQEYLKTAPESSYKAKPKLLPPASSQKMISQHKTPDSAFKTLSFSTLFARPITDTLACTPPLETKGSYCPKYDQLLDELPKSSQDLHEVESLDPVNNVPLNSQEGIFSCLPSLQEKNRCSCLSKVCGEHERLKESLKTAERPFHKVSCEMHLPFVAAKTEKTESSSTKADTKDGSFHTTDATQSEGHGSREALEFPHKNSSIRPFARPITGSEMLTNSRNLGQFQKSSHLKSDPRNEEVSFDTAGKCQTQEKVSRCPLSLHESKTFSDLSETSRCSMKHNKSRSPETQMFKSSTLKEEINKHSYQPIKTSQSKSLDNQKIIHFDCRGSSFSSLFARPITHAALCTPPTEKNTKSPQHLNQMVSLDRDKVLCSPSDTTPFTNLFARPSASSVPLNRNYLKEINEPFQSSAHQDKKFLLDTDKEGVLVTKVNPFRSLPSLPETKSCSNLPQVSRLNEKHQECLKSGPRNPHKVSHKVLPQSVSGSEISKSFKTKINVKEESHQHTGLTQSKGQRSPKTQDCLDTNNLFTSLFVIPNTDSLIPCSPHPQGDNISLKSQNLREEDNPVVQTLNNKIGNLPSLQETKPLSGLPQSSGDHRRLNETLTSSQRSSCEVQPELSHPSEDSEKSESLNTEAEIKESSFQIKDTTTRPNVLSSLQSSSKRSEPRRLDTTFSSLFVGALADGVTSNAAQPHVSVELEQLNGNEELLPPSGNSDCNLTEEPLMSSNHHNRNALPRVSPSRGSLLKTLFLNLGPFQVDGNQ